MRLFFNDNERALFLKNTIPNLQNKYKTLCQLPKKAENQNADDDLYQESQEGV